MARKHTGGPADALRDVIKRSGLRQAEWAHALGVSDSAVSQWLSGTGAPPSTSRLMEIRLVARSHKVPEDVLQRFEAAIRSSPNGAGSTRAPTFSESADRGRLAHLEEEIMRLDDADRRSLIDLYEEKFREITSQDHLPSRAAALSTAYGIVSRNGDAMVSAFLRDEIAELAGRAEHLSQTGSYVKWARIDTRQILELFTRLVLRMPEGYTYDTVSNLDFWSKHTLPSRGAFLAAQVSAMRHKKVRFRRVFLVPNQIPMSAEEKLRLQEHLRSSTGIEARVSPVPESEIAGIGNFVLCGKGKNPSTVLLEMLYRNLDQSDIREFERMTISSDLEKIQTRRAAFDMQFERGFDVAEFLQSPDDLLLPGRKPKRKARRQE